MVCTNAVNKMKHWLSGPEHRFCDSMDDIVRVMSVLDGKPEPDHRHATWHALNGAQWMRDGSDTTIQELQGYLSVKGLATMGNYSLGVRMAEALDVVGNSANLDLPGVSAPPLPGGCGRQEPVCHGENLFISSSPSGRASFQAFDQI